MLGYADFIRLFRVDDPETFDPGLVLRESGVFVAPRPADDSAIPEELAVLTEHPTGNLSEPALAFPFSIDQLKAFVEFYGLHGRIDPFAMAKVMWLHAFAEAQLNAQESGNYHWPKITELSRLRLEWQREHDTTKDDHKKVVWRTVLDALNSLLPDPERTDMTAATSPVDNGKPLRKDIRKNWLRIMRAQLEMMNLPEREVISDITQMIESLGFVGPKDDAVRDAIDEARALPSDKPPKLDVDHFSSRHDSMLVYAKDMDSAGLKVEFAPLPYALYKIERS